MLLTFAQPGNFLCGTCAVVVLLVLQEQFKFMSVAQRHVRCLSGLHKPTASTASNPTRALLSLRRQGKSPQKYLSTQGKNRKKKSQERQRKNPPPLLTGCAAHAVGGKLFVFTTFIFQQWDYHQSNMNVFCSTSNKRSSVAPMRRSDG